MTTNRSETWLYVASSEYELQGEGTKCRDGEDVFTAASAMAAALGCLVAIVVKVVISGKVESIVMDVLFS
jgi:hypothetical protein